MFFKLKKEGCNSIRKIICVVGLKLFIFYLYMFIEYVGGYNFNIINCIQIINSIVSIQFKDKIILRDLSIGYKVK